MGWNSGYTIYEKQIIALYNSGTLTKEVLNEAMEPFRDSDIDRGGSYDLRSKDGKSADNIVCLVMEPEKYKAATENFVPDPEDPDWNEALYKLWIEITRREWGLW